jgi:DNA-binding transcriptional LysR family regulator
LCTEKPLCLQPSSLQRRSSRNGALPDCARNPGFSFSIEIRQREYISHWMANQQFDVGFAPQPVNDPTLDAEPLVKAPVCVVLPAWMRCLPPPA